MVEHCAVNGRSEAVGFEVVGTQGDSFIVTDDAVEQNKIYLMPLDIVELIIEAQQELVSWDFAIEEATKAAREGRIGIITNIA